MAEEERALVDQWLDVAANLMIECPYSLEETATKLLEHFYDARNQDP